MTIRVLSFMKINFYEVDYNYIINYMMKKKGYLVLPAASSLIEVKKKKYLMALQKSTAALFDSGFFCVLIFIKKLKFFKKFSGYKFISYFLNDNILKKKKILSLDPSIKSANINNHFLKSKKFKFIKHYVCPQYNVNNLIDKNLLNIINEYKPEIILSNIGGGVQEILALYIKNNIPNKTVILCTGAALSFFTGEQAQITKIYDVLYIGWLKRLLFDPIIFYKRILLSLNLIFFIKSKKLKVLYK